MGIKIFSGIVAVTLMLMYLGPIAFKLKEPALIMVIITGFVMMLVDLWQSLQSKDD